MNIEKLSERERQIVNLIADGERVKDVAVGLGISTHTVRNHLKAIYRKLGIRSQFELIAGFRPSGSIVPSYEAGSRAAWTSILKQALVHLGIDSNASALIELAEAKKAAAVVCSDLGIAYPEGLNLGQIISDYIAREISDVEEEEPEEEPQGAVVVGPRMTRPLPEEDRIMEALSPGPKSFHDLCVELGVQPRQTIHFNKKLVAMKHKMLIGYGGERYYAR